MRSSNKLLAISGKKRSGKNTVATIINDILAHDPLEEKAFAHLVKKFASDMTGVPLDGWETETDKLKELGPEWLTFDVNGLKVPMTRRLFLKRLGSDACNAHLHPNCWVNGVFKDWTPDSRWIITDVRFPQEVKAVKEHDGVVIRVQRPATDKSGDNHISETALDHYNGFDYYIINDGTIEELREKVRNVLFQLRIL